MISLDDCIDLIYIILDEYYNIDFDEYPLIETHLIHYFSKNYYSWINKQLVYCFLQELDKIHFNKINKDIEIYKFNYIDRILISQLINTIHKYIIQSS
jgi:hypothetical protein